MIKNLLHVLILLATLASLPAQAADRAVAFGDAARLHRQGETAAAMAIWLPLARQGDADAAYNLAVIHQHGDGVARNPAEALKWYRVAAERGDRESQLQLGAMYLNGEGTARDEQEGWRWINKHRLDHVHHGHHPQMAAWREQAARMIWQRDMREALAASRQGGDRLLAELKQRAGLVGGPASQLAAGAAPVAALN